MNSKKFTILIIIILSGIVLIGLQANHPENITPNIAENTLAGFFLPVQQKFSAAGRKISRTWRSLANLSHLEEENQRLREEISAMREQQEIFKRTTGENRKLRQILDITREQEGKVVVAEVIARSPDNWFQTIKVNKGKFDGVTTNMVAVSPEGIVGRVVSTADQVSYIRLIFNEKSAIPARIVSSGEMGVVYGEGKNTCLMKYINADSRVNIGDQVITSSLGKIYPPDKIIGQVSKVYGREKVMYQTVQIKPAVQVNRLEFVLLMERTK
jgi:rod shape-determining protein MreC